MKQATRPCPLCDATTVRLLHEQHLLQPAGAPLPSKYGIAACTICGFVYADTPGSQRDYDSYYARYSKYEDSSVATGGLHTDQDKKRFTILADRIAGRIAKDAPVLDVGCANGGLLAALKERGFTRLHGLDGAADCVSAIRRMGFKSYQLGLSALNDFSPAQRFDFIVLSHVLEHLVDIKPVMLAIRKLLSPNGLIYLETPDASRYSASDFVPFYFFDSEHINHFDEDHLGYLGDAIGLSPIETGSSELELVSEKHYPVCWAWLSDQEDCGPNGPLDNNKLGDAIQSYVAQCTRSSIYPVLEELSGKGTRIIIWGAGSFAQRALCTESAKRCNIIGIVDTDRNKQGLSFASHRVRSPEYLQEVDGEFVVVVAAAIAYEAIAEQARNVLATVRLLKLA